MQWIRTLQLEQWSQRLDARNDFPQLVGDLVRQLASEVTKFRFPSGDKGQVRGFDGELECSGGSMWTPEGYSVWELGTNKDAAAKITSDFTKRSAQVPVDVQQETTFVFVSTWAWNNPQKLLPDFVKELSEIGSWKDVKYIDGSQLEHWLADCPSVAGKHARKILAVYPQTGARSLDDYWEEYASRFYPNIVEEVLLAGREAQAENLIGRLRTEKNGPLKYAADTPDEVIAFAIAAIRKADPEVRQQLDARCLVVETEDAIGQLAGHVNLIFFPRKSARSSAGRLLNRGPTIISASAEEQKNNHESLIRPSKAQLSKALEGMGYSSGEATAKAYECGCSLAVLQRRIPSATAEPPEWMDSAAALLPALLAGGWSTAVVPDTTVVTALAGKEKYEEVEEPLRPLLRKNDPPIDCIGDAWKMRASVDAFLNLAHLIGQEHLDRFEAQAKIVFAVGRHTPKPEEPFSISRRTKPEHSDWLREGMMNLLLHISVFHQHTQLRFKEGKGKDFVSRVVRELPGLSTDHRMMVSLGEDLPILAEAAPGPFLDALERLLEGDAEKIKPIFDEEPGIFSVGNAHVCILWALETIAWDTELLLRACTCLARLAKVDPGGQLVNRPINSLRSILLPWSPNTNATYQQRLGVLSDIIQRVPEVAWPLVQKLLPTPMDSSDGTHKPRFRESVPGGEEVLTYGIVWECEYAIAEHAVRLAGVDYEKWHVLINTLHSLHEPTFEFVFKSLQVVLSRQEEDDRFKTWDYLRKEINRHKAFEGVEWAFGEGVIARLDEVVERFRPRDLILENSWLFDDWTPDIPGKLDDGDIMQRIEARRLDAVTNVFNELGVAGLLKLVEKVKLPSQMIVALRSLKLNEIEHEQLISQLWRLGDLARPLAIGLVPYGYEQFGAKWFISLVSIAVDLELPASEVAQLYLAFDDSQFIWEIVGALGEEVDREYWLRKQAFSFNGQLVDLLDMIRRFGQVGRWVAAIQAALGRLSEIPTETIFKALDEAVEEINASGNRYGNMLPYFLGKVFEELEARESVPRSDLAQREFKYLPLFSDRKKPLALHGLMVEEPEMFVSAIRLAFKSDVGDDPEPTKEDRRMAKAAYNLLGGLKILPGQTNDDINYELLRDWCVEVRRLGDECHRLAITESRIGHLFAHAPASQKDGVWPHEAVRKLIESDGSKSLIEGLSVERFNMRGVYSKGIGEGGKQERQLAETYRGWAKAMPESPKTSAILSGMAATWDRYAEQEDLRVEQEALRW